MNATVSTMPENSAKQLMLAAHEAFNQEGALPINYGVVAEKAGVSRALIYTHFPTSEDIVNGILDWQVELLERAGLTTESLTGEFKSDALMCLEIYYKHLVAYGPLIHVASQDHYMSGKLSRRYRRMRDRLIKHLARSVSHQLQMRPQASMSFVILIASLAEEGARLVRSRVASKDSTWVSVRKATEIMIDGMTPSAA